MSKKILCCIVLFSVALLNASAQSLLIDYGSPDINGEGLFFADETQSFYDGANVPGIITVGYFNNISSLSTFSDYLSNFTQVGDAESFSNATSPGFLGAQALTTDAIPENTEPYVFVLGGISDFTNATNASSFSIYSDSGWDSFPALGSPSPSTLDLQTTIEPNNIVVGQLNSIADGFRLDSSPVPEPSTYALIAGFLILGYIVIRRRK